MDQKFLMGNNDGLARVRSFGNQATTVSPRLRKALLAAAIQSACEAYSTFFDAPIPDRSFTTLASDYEEALANANALGLLNEGGVREKDHLSLWCLGRVLAPYLYVESGVFTGSSLHAIMRSSPVRKIFAIDPNLSALRIPRGELGSADLVSDRDFSQIAIDLSPPKTLVYFDDHINSAARILQAAAKGARYVLFDDSTGFEGVCQRLYPAVPTVPMIVHSHLFTAGDEVSWTFGGDTRVTMSVTQEFVESCTRAKNLVRKWIKAPELGEFLPQSKPERTPDTSKYLLELGPA